MEDQVDEAADGAVDAPSWILQVVDLAVARMRARVEPAVPDVDYLSVLGDELAAAVADPASVPFPELADPDRYWAAAVAPQQRSLRHHITTVIGWAGEQIEGTLDRIESEVGERVEAAAHHDQVGPNPVAARTDTLRALGSRLEEVHEAIGRLAAGVDDGGRGAEARVAFDEALRRRAEDDVDGLHDAYLRDAGGDESHQLYAQQQWEATWGERVEYRATLLRHEVPWRHQELALIGHERSHVELADLVGSVVQRLQARLAEVAGSLVARYDAVSEVAPVGRPG